jgi:hypothetical protein
MADLLQESEFNFVDVASGYRLSLTAAPMSHGGGGSFEDILR